MVPAFFMLLENIYYKGIDNTGDIVYIIKHRKSKLRAKM